MSLGIVYLLDLENPADWTHARILMVTTVIYCVSAFFFLLYPTPVYQDAAKFWSSKVQVELSKSGIQWLYTVLFFSLLISLLYYVAVGYNLLLDSASAAIRGEEIVDVAGLRLEAYSGSRYLAPGYVNQFRIMLLPLSAAVLYVAKLRRSSSTTALKLMVPIILVLVAGTGQRGAAVTILLIVLLYRRMLDERRTKTLRANWKLLLVGTVSFVGMSFLQERTADGRGWVRLVVEPIWFRIFQSNQIGSVAGFRVVSELPLSNGREWIDSALGILPGNPGSDLSSVIFASLYGSSRGSAPISVWGSVWHNLGWIGIVLTPVGLAWLHAYVYRKLVSGPRSVTRLGSYAATIILLSTWIAGDFMYLLNTGALAAIFLYKTTIRVQHRPSVGAVNANRLQSTDV